LPFQGSSSRCRAARRWKRPAEPSPAGLLLESLQRREGGNGGRRVVHYLTSQLDPRVRL